MMFARPISISAAEILAHERAQRLPGDRRLHACERRRPRRVARKIRKRHGAARYRDAVACKRMHEQQRRRPGSLEREIIGQLQAAHDRVMHRVMLYGTPKHVIYENPFPRPFYPRHLFPMTGDT